MFAIHHRQLGQSLPLTTLLTSRSKNGVEVDVQQNLCADLHVKLNIKKADRDLRPCITAVQKWRSEVMSRKLRPHFA